MKGTWDGWILVGLLVDEVALKVGMVEWCGDFEKG